MNQSSINSRKLIVILAILLIVATMLVVSNDSSASDDRKITTEPIVIDNNTKEGTICPGADYSIEKDYVTLELDNLKLESYGNVKNQSWISSAIYIAVDKPAHIALIGGNSITLKSSNEMKQVQSGIYCSGMLVIEGTGTLHINTVDVIRDGSLHTGIYDHFGNIVISANITIDVGTNKANVSNADIENIRCENGNVQIYKSKVSLNVHGGNGNSFRCLYLNKTGNMINDSTIIIGADSNVKSGYVVDMHYDNADGFDIIKSSFWYQNGNIPVFNTNFNTIHICDIDDCYALINGEWKDISREKVIEGNNTFGLRLGTDPIEHTTDNTALIVLGAIILIALLALVVASVIKKKTNR